MAGRRSLLIVFLGVLLGGCGLVLLGSCNRSSSTGAPRQRFITFNPSSGTLYSVDVQPIDGVFLDDSRDLGTDMDGFAAGEDGTVAIVFDRETGFLVFVSYADPRDLVLAATDIGRVSFDIGDVSLSRDGRIAVFEDAARQEIQLLDLSRLNELDYSSSFVLDEAIASLIQSPESAFALILPSISPDRVFFLDYGNFEDPVLEFSLPNMAPLQLLEFVPDNPTTALAVETATGRILALVFENALPAGEIVADVIDLGNPEIRAVAFIPFRQEAYVGTNDGMVHRLNLENPFRMFLDGAGSIETRAAGDDLILAVSPDGEFLLASANQGVEIYDVSDRTNPTLLRRFDFGSAITEIGFSSENSGRFRGDPTAYIVLGGATIHLIGLADRRFPELSPGTGFPALVASVQQDDPAGGRISGLDASGSIFYVTVTLREQDAPRSLGPFAVSPPIGSGFGDVIFFVK